MSVLKLQFFILLGGTLFAWANVMLEFINWSKGKKCKRGCNINPKNPFLSNCFIGAIFFTFAFILNILL